MYDALLAVLCHEARTGRLQYSLHYSMRSFQRSMPDSSQIEYLLCDDDPDIVETRKTDLGKSNLIWGIMKEGRVAHVLCSWPPDAVVITAYWPDTEPEEWMDNYRRRVRK